MKKWHLVAKIETLLKKHNLENYEVTKKELLKKKKKGNIYINLDNCKTFDSKSGCNCFKKDV
jgi:hypothetical protein